MSIKIITDSSCDLPPELIKEHDITVVPLSVSFENGETFIEGVDITPEQFWERLAVSGELPKTSRPSPDSFATAFRESLKHYSSVIFLGISSAISGTFESAQLAARSVAGDIHLIDSLTGSLGLGVLAVRASEIVRSGANIQSSVKKITEYRDGMHTLFTMDSLENLIKGGRLGRLPGFVGTFLDIKPIGKATDKGRIDVLERVRGRNKSLKRLIGLMEEMGSNLQEKIVGISHLDCFQEAQRLKETVEDKIKPRQVILGKIGTTMGTYAGKGGIILSF